MRYQLENNLVLKLLLIIGIAITLARPAVAGELVVIVNASNPVANMSKGDVSRHFLLKRGVWSNGEKIRPVGYKSVSDMSEAFNLNVLDMTNDDVERYWLQAQYASAKKPPTGVNDDATAIKFVSRFKGGIGFVNKDSMGAADSNVKSVLEIAY